MQQGKLIVMESLKPALDMLRDLGVCIGKEIPKPKYWNLQPDGAFEASFMGNDMLVEVGHAAHDYYLCLYVPGTVNDLNHALLHLVVSDAECRWSSWKHLQIPVDGFCLHVNFNFRG